MKIAAKATVKSNIKIHCETQYREPLAGLASIGLFAAAGKLRLESISSCSPCMEKNLPDRSTLLDILKTFFAK